jgi:hypothetical protein
MLAQIVIVTKFGNCWAYNFLDLGGERFIDHFFMDVFRSFCDASMCDARISPWNCFVSACHSNLDSTMPFWIKSPLKVRRVDEAIGRVSSEFVLAFSGGKSSMVLFLY